MAKLVLRCKNAHHLFVKNINGNSVSFTENLEEAYSGGGDLVTAEDFYYQNELCKHLFEMYEVPEPEYAIRVVGTELYVESIFSYMQFTEDLRYVLKGINKQCMKEMIDKIKHKVKSKLEVVKL